jgi:hypothetical protein
LFIMSLTLRRRPAPADDPVALVASLNLRRRGSSSGQRAIAAAEAWDMVEVETGAAAHRKSGKSSQTSRSAWRRDKLATMFGVNPKYVQQARALLARDPDAAEAVKAGDATLAEAYQALPSNTAPDARRAAPSGKGRPRRTDESRTTRQDRPP